MVKRRRTLQTDPEFIERLKKMQGKIKSNEGIEPSLTDLTKQIMQDENFQDIEKKIIQRSERLSLNIKLDGNIR